jgi:hypothetical protein
MDAETAFVAELSFMEDINSLIEQRKPISQALEKGIDPFKTSLHPASAAAKHAKVSQRRIEGRRSRWCRRISAHRDMGKPVHGPE